MTTKTLLDYERRQAERALHREHRLAEINRGTYQPTAEERTIDYWTLKMTHDGPNKGAELRNYQRHQLNERLRLIEPPKPARRPIIKPQDLEPHNPMVYCDDCHAWYDGDINTVICNEGEHAPLS